MIVSEEVWGLMGWARKRWDLVRASPRQCFLKIRNRAWEMV